MTDSVVSRLVGAFPVLPTPFHVDQSLDLDSLGRLVDRLLDKGVKGLTFLGSSAESTYLSEGERCSLLEYATKRVAGRATVIAGIIRFGTVNAVDQAKRFRDLGADAVMVAVPQYYETPLSKLIVHFDSIVKGAKLPTLYYHYPKPTHLTLDNGQVAKLFAEVPLVGIKNSALDTANTIAMIAAIDRPIQMFSGQGFDLLACLKGGAVGAISAEGVLLPVTTQRIVDEHHAGNGDAAQQAQTRLYQAIPFVAPEQNDEGPINVAHGGVKEALVAMGIFESARLRDPQPDISEEKRSKIRELAPRLVEL